MNGDAYDSRPEKTTHDLVEEIYGLLDERAEGAMDILSDIRDELERTRRGVRDVAILVALGTGLVIGTLIAVMA